MERLHEKFRRLDRCLVCATSLVGGLFLKKDAGCHALCTLEQLEFAIGVKFVVRRFIDEVTDIRHPIIFVAFCLNFFDDQ